MGWLQIHKTENLTMEPATGDATRDHVLLGSLHLAQTPNEWTQPCSQPYNHSSGGDKEQTQKEGYPRDYLFNF